MNKKVIIIIVVAVVIIAGALGAYLIFASGDYSTYKKAFKNTFEVSSMELNTTVRAVYDGGSRISSTGNFKLKDMDTNPQFINTMTIGGQVITQFSDGQYIYTEDTSGGQTNRNRIRIGAEPEPKQQEQRPSNSFSLDDYISEFSGLLDASKIKELNLLEGIDERYVDKIESVSVSGGKRFVVTLLPQAVDDLVDTFLRDNLSNQSMAPTIEVNTVIYTATVVSDYVSEIAISIDMDVTAPSGGSPTRATVDFIIEPANPGRAVNFTLPSTDGF